MKPIGTIRWTASEGKVSRLVVAKEYRRYGFGRVLMDAVNEHIAGSGVTEDLNGIVEEKEGIRVVKVKMHAQVSLPETPLQSVMTPPDARDCLLQEIRVCARGA